MYVSKESVAETNSRLERVFRNSRFEVYEDLYRFEEREINGSALVPNKDALAIVRDDKVWSQLVPSRKQGEEAFKLFRFHFPDGVDNSGFVGWLASIVKRKTGSGVFVICGQNSADGGIYDYYGCPVEVAGKLKTASASCEERKLNFTINGLFGKRDT